MYRKFIFLSVVAVIFMTMATQFSHATYHVGDTVNNFTLPDSEGNQVSLYNFSGMVVLLNFWTST